MTSISDPIESLDALPAGYWPPDRVRAIMEQTVVTETAPIRDDLSTAERVAVRALVAAGRILDDVFQDQLHHQALSSRDALRALHEQRGRVGPTEALVQLQELWLGPIVTTLDNERVPFLPVDPEEPGRNLYPRGVSRESIEGFLADHPDERASILDPCTVVRSMTTASLRGDLAVLRRHPALAQLHASLAGRLERLLAEPAPRSFYAVPYSIAWADELVAASAELEAAADAITEEDRDFAAFLRIRARDLLANDYEGGDAAWIRGEFGRLDAVIGPYEAYDDDLFGVKAFFGLRVLVRNETESASLREALGNLQSIENALPIDRHEAARTAIPVGIFDAVADFGYLRYQSVIASILPNEPDLLRKYGRKIVLAHNFITTPAELARVGPKWRAAMAPDHGPDLTAEGLFLQTAWHEVGHDLGPRHQIDGRSVRDGLQDLADLLEELKAELLSAFATAHLRDKGKFESGQVRAIQAVLLLECLRPIRPNRAQPYEMGRLVMANGFLDRGVLVPVDGRLAIRYDAMDAAVEAMLREVLDLQYRGSRASAEAFVERNSTWDERHESIAAAVNGAAGQRFHRFRNRA